MNCFQRREGSGFQLVKLPAFKKLQRFFLLIRSSSRARSAEFVSPNLFSSAIVTSKFKLFFGGDARFHPSVHFTDLEFPKASDFVCGHISFFDPSQYRVTADAQIRCYFLHGIPAFKVVVHHKAPVFAEYNTT